MKKWQLYFVMVSSLIAIACAIYVVWFSIDVKTPAPAHVPKAIPSEVYICYKCGDTICDYGSGFCEKCFGDTILTPSE